MSNQSKWSAWQQLKAIKKADDKKIPAKVELKPVVEKTEITVAEEAPVLQIQEEPKQEIKKIKKVKEAE